MAEQKLTKQNPVLEKIQAGKSNLVMRLPKGVDKERFVLGIMTAIQKSQANSKPGQSLADCDPNSVLLAAYDAAEVGCSLSPALQHGWLINYGGQAQFQPSYRFFIQKAYETGEVKTFYAECVYAGDEFNRQFAPKRNLFHAPSDGERSRKTVIGAYALIEFTDGTIDWEYLTTEQIERHRGHSKQPNSMKWTTFFEEGYRITPIRVIAKRLPLKNRNLEGLVEMINRDTERDGIISVEEVAPLAIPRRLSETETVTSPAGEPEPEKAKAASATTSAEPAKPSNGGNGAPQGGTMFGEEDPFLNPAEIKEFWDKVFAAGWKKQEVVPHLTEKFQLAAVKDIRKSQLKPILDEFLKPEPGSEG